MTLGQALATLESLGTEQNRKIFAKHGATGPCYGVSFADLDKLRKQIKTNQALAEELWFSGNYDACNLATLIADPQAMSSGDLEKWGAEVRNAIMADLLARNIAGKTPHAREKAERWMQSPKEMLAATGWNLLASIAMSENDLPDSYFEKHLRTIESAIHSSQNRVRHSMNSALIAIGGRNGALQKLALAAAARIGKVDVDHGETSCKTPDATAYIQKLAARATAKKAPAKAARTAAK